MHKIAIVEGDFSLLQLYKLKFTDTNYHVRTASDGLSGFKLLKSFRPDLLFMDIKLPVMDGVETVEKYLKLHSDHKPTIIMSSNLDEPVATRLFGHLGIDKYIVKAHYTPGQMLQLADSYLQR